MTVDQQLRQGLLERIEHLHQLVDVSAGDALLTWLVEGRGGRGRFGIVPEVSHEDAPEGIASSDEVLAVAAQGHARDLIAVPLEGLEFFATGRLPQARRVVKGSCHEVLAVAAQGHAHDKVGVSFEALEGSGYHPTEPDRHLETARELSHSRGPGLTASWEEDEEITAKAFAATPSSLLPTPRGGFPR